MLVPMRSILEAADTYHYGQAAFNMNSAGQIEAAIRIHELLRSGAIRQARSTCSPASPETSATPAFGSTTPWTKPSRPSRKPTTI